jgi:anti-sigma factor RsiW
MRQVEEYELSALLDGELDPQRAEEVRACIESDPALREQFNALKQLDARLRRTAEQARFVPEIAFPAEPAGEAPAWQWAAGLAVVTALIGVRLLPKLVELAVFGLALQLAACAAIAFVVIGMAREPQPLAIPAFGKGIGA